MDSGGRRGLLGAAWSGPVDVFLALSLVLVGVSVLRLVPEASRPRLLQVIARFARPWRRDAVVHVIRKEHQYPQQSDSPSITWENCCLSRRPTDCRWCSVRLRAVHRRYWSHRHPFRHHQTRCSRRLSPSHRRFLLPFRASPSLDWRPPCAGCPVEQDTRDWS